MSSEDAVFTAAVARSEVRKSLSRLEYHLARGPRGVRGVEREVAFLDALGRQSARLGGRTAAGAAVGSKPGLGVRARAAMAASRSGHGVASGRLKSSLLAEYSQDTMSASRDWTYGGNVLWVWIANASACPACLDNHGKTMEGPFVPMHPSCLCYPEKPERADANGVRPLSPTDVVRTLANSNNSAFASVGRAIASGRMSVADAASAATRRSSKGMRRWAKTLDDQAERAAALGDDVATFVDDVPTVAEITEAATAEAVEELVKIDWLKTMGDSGTKIKYSARRHARTISEAQDILNKSVTSARFRALMDDAMSRLRAFKTLSDTNKGRQTRWAGRFKHSKPYKRDPVTGKLVQVDESIKSIELQMRWQNTAAIDDWNALVKAYNAESKVLNDEIRAARLKVRQANRGFTSFQVDEAIDPDIWRRQRELQARKPKKGSVGLTEDRPVQDVAEVLLHEVTHAVDEATDFAYSAKALEDGVRDEFRRLAASDDELAASFRYGAERGMGQNKGHETFAEVVRMYHHGTGIMTPDGAAKQSAAAWREAHPSLAKWVEENVL